MSGLNIAFAWGPEGLAQVARYESVCASQTVTLKPSFERGARKRHLRLIASNDTPQVS